MAKPNLQSAPSPVGENKPRIDAREKVTGAAIFADDLQFGNGLLHARIKRSPHPHALIKRLDISKASALPGVKAVVTGEDFPGYIGLYLQDRYIFCRDRVRYVGDPVAGVAAVSEEIAHKALDLIEVEYEILEPVLDPEYGASEEAPRLHPDLGSYVVANLTASVLTASKKGWKHLALLPVVYAILHLSYGLGFLAGLVKFWNRWSDKRGRVPEFEPKEVEGG